MDFTTLASDASLQKTVDALTAHHFNAMILQTKAEALEYIKKTIPQAASIMNGASVTLDEIGYIEVLKAGGHGWNNLHDAVLAEKDPAKQAVLRKQSAVSDYYLGSVHAATETGELVIASNSGSQLSHLAFTSPNLILVVGTQKIVPTLDQALERIQEYVIPLEDERMKRVAGYGTAFNKELILRGENPAIGRSVMVLFVKEKLGF